MIIDTNQLRKSYPARTGRTRLRVDAVAGVDLRIKEAEIFGLLGPNGAGKTTTLRMLATLLPPDSGEATVAGADLRTEPQQVRRRLGYVGQKGGTTGAVSAREELVHQARLYGLGKAEATRRAAKAIADFELTEYADRLCRTYSGGQRRSLDIALGIIHRPAVVLLDEPSAGLDPASRAGLWAQVRRLRDEGITVILTTHYLDEADALCDRLSIIDHGTIVAEGTPGDLKAQVAGDVVTVRLAGGRPSTAAPHAASDTAGPAGPADPAGTTAGTTAGAAGGPAARGARVLRGHAGVQRVETLDDHQLRIFVAAGVTSLAPVIRALDEAGLTIVALNLHQPSLDDVFQDKTGRSLRVPAEHPTAQTSTL